jgi:hypothetical protein
MLCRKLLWVLCGVCALSCGACATPSVSDAEGEDNADSNSGNNADNAGNNSNNTGNNSNNAGNNANNAGNNAAPNNANNAGNNSNNAGNNSNNADNNSNNADNNANNAEAPLLSIYAVRNPADQAHPATGQEVRVEGVVTASTQGRFWLQDPAGGPWSALLVYNNLPADQQPAPGARVQARGLYEEHVFEDGDAPITQLNLARGGALTLQGEALELTPEAVPLSELADPQSAEPWESVLVSLPQAQVGAARGFGEWDLVGGYILDDYLYSYHSSRLIAEGRALPGLSGIHTYNFGAWKLAPRGITDLFPGCDPGQDADCDGTPTGRDVCPGVWDAEQGDADADEVGDLCDNCPQDTNPDQTDADADRFGDACDFDVVPQTTVRDLRDPRSGSNVQEGDTVRLQELVVTAVGPRRVWAQDASGGAWSGILVFFSDANLSIPGLRPGSVVTVTGTYVEYQGGDDEGTVSEVTISEPSQLVMVDVGDPPTPHLVTEADLTNPASAESWENVLVQLQGVEISAELDFGQWGFAGGYLMDDFLYPYNQERQDIELGASFSALVGVHSYSFNQFKLLPRGAEDFVP